MLTDEQTKAARWLDEVRQYLTAAADSSMSRNNSEQLAYELLEALPANALEAQAREIAKIEQENDLFRQHAAKQISDTTLLTGIDISNGPMNMGLQGGAAQLLAESFFDQFQKSEAVNYLELRFESESKMPGKAMVVTLQLVDGVTPGQRIAEQAREIERLCKDAALVAARERERVAQHVASGPAPMCRYGNRVEIGDAARQAYAAAIRALNTEGEGNDRP